MPANRLFDALAIGIGVVALVAGLAAFLVPLGHPGPYGLPGRGLVGGVGGLVIAALLLAPRLPRSARIAALLVSPPILFLALYAALAELEEVVVLYAGGPGAGAESELRLWIVDHEGAEWVSMQAEKMRAHALDGARLELQRGGERRCVVPRHVDDPAVNQRTFDLRQEKYAIQRLAVSLGLFDDGPSPTTVTLRLDPCV